MNPETLSLEGLEDQVRSLTVAESPADVFKTLLEGVRLAAPRASVFLVRQGQLKGWGAVGYPPDAARRQREYIGPVAEGWLGEITRSEPPLHATDSQGGVPGFGQPVPVECVGIAVRLKGRPIALLVTERMAGEHPWYPAVLGILVRVAQLRLDLDLARRKLATGGRVRPQPSPGDRERPSATVETPHAAPEVVSEAPERAETASVTATREEPAISEPADLAAVSADVMPDEAPVAPTEAAADEDPKTEAARRYARLVATDIRLYNEEAVVLGRKDGDLAERLKESLARGKETFLRRHGDLGSPGLRILHNAYVQVLAGGEESLIPTSLLE
jgi:hypothetical protein